MDELSPIRDDSMPYRKCGPWGLKPPVLSLGALETFGDDLRWPDEFAAIDRIPG